MNDEFVWPKCDVCGGNTIHQPCMECVKARHKGVLTRRCVCGKKKIPGDVVKTASRSFIPCKRCLQSIKQLS